jgi:hypothetical protein
MLTPGDGRNDGAKLRYLARPTVWRHHDPGLFDALREVATGNLSRDVSAIEHAMLFGDGRYFSGLVPDDMDERAVWFAAALRELQSSDLLFFDPDNGIEVASVAKGRRRSSKYVYWDELADAWRTGKSLLVFQHFAREERASHIDRLTAMLAEQTPGSLIGAWRSANVLFLFAGQPGHAALTAVSSQLIQERWGTRLAAWGPASGVSGNSAPSIMSAATTLVLLEEPARRLPTHSVHTDGEVIEEALNRSAPELVHRRVACPACTTFIFRMWPEGWDSHAAFRCLGLNATTREERKREYRQRFGHLFHSG